MFTTKDISIIKALVEEEIIKSEQIKDAGSSSLMSLYKNSLLGIGRELDSISKQIEMEYICG